MITFVRSVLGLFADMRTEDLILLSMLFFGIIVCEIDIIIKIKEGRR